MTKFNQVKDKHMETLELYVPIVARVHGEAHPEFHHVHRVFNDMKLKIKKPQQDKLDLDLEFKDLRKITHEYRVPADTCESYEAVYKMLAELDKAYYEEVG